MAMTSKTSSHPDCVTGNAARAPGRRIRPGRGRTGCTNLFTVAAVFCIFATSAAAFDEFSYDIRLVRALNRIGMYDYAALQLQRMQKRYSTHRDEIRLEQARTLLLTGRSREGKKILSSIPPSSPVYIQSRLILAETAYEKGDLTTAAKAFADYFAKVKKPRNPSPEAVEEFREAVQKYAALLRHQGDSRKAAQVLEYLAGLPGEAGLNERQLTFVKYQAIVAAEEQKARKGEKIDKAAVTGARNRLEGLQWKGVDAVAAAGLVEAARADVLLGNYDRAIRTLQGGDEILHKVEEVLDKEGKHDDSPVAGAHFYLGRALAGKAAGDLKAGRKDAARKGFLTAAKQFFVVTKKYPGSKYAADALAEFGKVRDELEKKFGKRIRLKGGGAAAEADLKRRQAEAFYTAGDFERALPLFLDALRGSWGTKAFPQAAERTVACFARLGRFLEAEAVASYLAEAAPGNSHTADALLKLGALLYKRARAAEDAGERERLMAQAIAVWNRFIATAPTHEKASDIAFFLAENAYKHAAELARKTKSMKPGKEKEELKKRARELFKQAAPLYERVADLYPGTPQGVRAWYKLGWALYSAEERKKAAEAFLKYAHLEADPGRADDRLEAEIRAAECLMFSDAPEKAVDVLDELRKWVAPDNTQGFNPRAPKARKTAELAANYIGWAWDLAAEKLRPQLTALRDERRELERRIASLQAQLKSIDERRRELTRERDQALRDLKEQQAVLSEERMQVLAASAAGKGGSAPSGKRNRAAPEDAERARRLAAERQKQERERLAGEKIVLEQKQKRLQEEAAALLRESDGTKKAGAIPQARRKTKHAWIQAELAAVKVTLDANRKVREFLDAPEEQRAALEKAAAAARREALAAWEKAVEAHLRYFDAYIKHLENQKVAIRKELREIEAKIASLDKKMEPLQKQFRDRKERALAAFQAFLKEFPKSDLVPDTMGRLGTIYVELDRYDDAARILNDLARRFPKSEAVHKAFFQLGRAETELGHLHRAVEAFRRLLKSPEDVPLGNLVYISDRMLDDKPEISLAASRAILARAAKQPDEVSPAARENALFRAAEACFKLKRYKDALAYYERLLKEFPRSPYYFEVRLHAGIARREKKPPEYDRALQDFTEIVQYCSDPALLNQTLCEVGRTYERMGGDEKRRLALARYQQVALVASAALPDNRPWIELALARSAVLAAQVGDATLARETAARLQKEFPESRYLPEVRKALKTMRKPAPTPEK